jgi:hypothetical protein
MTIPSSGPVTFTDIQTEFGGTNPIALNEYYAGGGLVPAGTTGTYGAVPSSGQISVQNFYGTTAYTPIYIEEVFSTYLYTGNSSTQTITNGIDLSTKGGIVWCKGRSAAGYSNVVYDTINGVNKRVATNLTNALTTAASSLTAFNTTGFSLGADAGGEVNENAINYASWTFRKQPKFFDVVTFTGNGTAGRTVAHNLGSVPGCIIVKRTDAANGWPVYHRSMNASPQDYMMRLNATDAAFTTSPSRWNNTLPTATEFTLSGNDEVNGSGATYVAYLFAHDAGGFGLTGTDNVISCGSFDANLGEVINLGYEPQWLFYKASADVDNWRIADNMRGLTNLSGTNAYTIQQLRPNSSAVESENSGPVLTSTGFTWNQSGGGVKHIYIAIRRGPMKVPTDATKVFSPVAASNSGDYVVNAGFPPDTVLATLRDFTSGYNHSFFDRLRGNSNYLASSSTNAESGVIVSPTAQIADFSRNQNGIFISSGTVFAYSTLLGITYVWHNFRRAPGFFDEICWTATGAAQTLNHNLSAVPELMIRKRRDSSTGGQWDVYVAPLGATNKLILNDTSAVDGNSAWNNTTPTSSVVYMNNTVAGWTFVTYLFATLAGISKVGSYTGTGTTLQINCGFTGGSRFVMIKRTDSAGDWFVWDSARGIVPGNDPYFVMNTTAVEVTGTDYVDTYSAGFEVTSTAPAGLNATGGTYIFLAIA